MISVVITTYNRPDLLREALASVAAQTLPPDEIIVVDDASPTGVGDIIADFPDLPVRYQRLPDNQGACYCRNIGAESARGTWLAFLDDDDRWLPDKLSVQMKLLKQHPDAIACLCSFLSLETQRPNNGNKALFVTADALRASNPYCGTSGLVVRKDQFMRTRFDESLPCAQDWDIYIRLLQCGPILNSTHPLFEYRRGAHDTISRKDANMTMAQVEERFAAANKHRQWMGEWHYRRRISHRIISYLQGKPDKLKWIRRSIARAGFWATASVLWAKVRRRY